MPKKKAYAPPNYWFWNCMERTPGPSCKAEEKCWDKWQDLPEDVQREVVTRPDKPRVSPPKWKLRKQRK